MRARVLPREKIFKHLLQRAGVLKINNMFNYAPLGEVRKLAGRLLVECLHGHTANQDFFCELIDLEPLYGRVILN